MAESNPRVTLFWRLQMAAPGWALVTLPFVKAGAGSVALAGCVAGAAFGALLIVLAAVVNTLGGRARIGRGGIEVTFARRDEPRSPDE